MFVKFLIFMNLMMFFALAKYIHTHAIHMRQSINWEYSCSRIACTIICLLVLFCCCCYMYTRRKVLFFFFFFLVTLENLFAGHETLECNLKRRWLCLDTFVICSFFFASFYFIIRIWFTFGPFCRSYRKKN